MFIQGNLLLSLGDDRDDHIFRLEEKKEKKREGKARKGQVEGQIHPCETLSLSHRQLDHSSVHSADP